MTFDLTSVEVTCVTLPKDHCVQVPWEYINVCGYSDQFLQKLPHTYTYILHTHTTYRISDHIVSFWTTFRRDKKGKVENWKWKEEKLQNEEWTSPPPLSTFQTTEICFGSTKWEFSTGKKAFHAGKKISKNDFAPSEKYSCYASDWHLDPGRAIF